MPQFCGGDPTDVGLNEAQTRILFLDKEGVYWSPSRLGTHPSRPDPKPEDIVALMLITKHMHLRRGPDDTRVYARYWITSTMPVAGWTPDLGRLERSYDIENWFATYGMMIDHPELSEIL